MGAAQKGPSHIGRLVVRVIDLGLLANRKSPRTSYEVNYRSYVFVVVDLVPVSRVIEVFRDAVVWNLETHIFNQKIYIRPLFSPGLVLYLVASPEAVSAALCVHPALLSQRPPDVRLGAVAGPEVPHQVPPLEQRQQVPVVLLVAPQLTPGETVQALRATLVLGVVPGNGEVVAGVFGRGAVAALLGQAL